jgi:hypothetical protein
MLLLPDLSQFEIRFRSAGFVRRIGQCSRCAIANGKFGTGLDKNRVAVRLLWSRHLPEHPALTGSS